MNYILFDGPYRNNLLPFTFTRPVADIRIGILNIREKWQHFLQTELSTKTEDYLQEKWALKLEQDNIFLCGSVIPTQELIDEIQDLKTGESLVQSGMLLGYRSERLVNDSVELKSKEFSGDLIIVENTWDIFSKNAEAIEQDFELVTADRKSQPIPDSVFTKNPDKIFIEEGAEIENCSLNASKGPIYIGKNTLIMEGCHIRGPVSFGHDSIAKMGAKIYGPTTVGPFCRAGGEINNAVMFQNSNKGHDGYLGNAVLGEWCNLGADTNNSNLKNNYAEVRLWNYASENFAKTGLQFCGLMMGDHSKCGINTMFNTGTVIGVSANIFGTGFPRNFVPGFSWGGSAGMSTYKLEKALETAELVMKRRDVPLTEADRNIMANVFKQSSKWRRD